MTVADSEYTPTDEEVRKPEEWAADFGIKVHDPDGWDRKNFAESWAKPISASEFAHRAAESTCEGDFTKLRAAVAAIRALPSTPETGETT